MSGEKGKKRRAPLCGARLNKTLKEIGRAADKHGVGAYLVGGAVRDMLLGNKHLDRDIVVEGNPGPLVRELGRKWHARLRCHDRFGTYVLALPGGRHIDFVTARKEEYPNPGVLPIVTFSSLKDDLFRRDFTLNALALALNGPGAGQVIDYYGGVADLQRGVLRILHRKSFRDDPTRIFRLARFAGRGFSIDPLTERQAAAGKRHLQCLSFERIREEFLAILAEKDPLPALRLLEKWGVLQQVLPGVSLDEDVRRLKNLPHGVRRIGFLLRNLPDDEVRKLLHRLRFPCAVINEIDALRRPRKRVPQLSGNDLIAMGYAPGPLFGKILGELSRHRFKSRRQARRFVFDKFPEKI